MRAKTKPWYQRFIDVATGLLERGEELTPVLFLYNRDNGEVDITALYGAKEQWPALAMEAVERHQADEVAMVCSSWALNTKRGDDIELPWGSIENDPRRIHLAMFHYRAREGEERTWVAEYDLSADQQVVNLQGFEERDDAVIQHRLLDHLWT